MNFIQANLKHLDEVAELVRITIKETYPKYYNVGIVNFFLNHHSKENIDNDIKGGKVWLLYIDNTLIGTGSYEQNHITRVYILPKYQNKGFGSFVIAQLENKISKNFKNILLDSSLPAGRLYEKLGYKTIKHCVLQLNNNCILAYEIMNKDIHFTNSIINYNNKIFTSISNTKNGEVNAETTFYYYQDNNVIWANYFGGNIIKGYLIGVSSSNGELDFHYQHINNLYEIKIGKCHSTPKILLDGKIELHENWKWLNGDLSEGTSIIIEK